jgi:hypothetical protein
MRRYKIALLLGLLALSAAGCGDGDDGDGVASVDSDASESASEGADGEELDGFEEALAYSECMRDNGIAEFPDPQQGDGGGMSLSLPEGLDPEDEDFKAAEEACEDLRPGPDGGETLDPEVYEELLAFSECMRENGIENFPDPDPGGGIMMGPDMGFDPQSEEYMAAMSACGDLQPGRGGAVNASEDE